MEVGCAHLHIVSITRMNSPLVIFWKSKPWSSSKVLVLWYAAVCREQSRNFVLKCYDVVQYALLNGLAVDSRRLLLLSIWESTMRARLWVLCCTFTICILWILAVSAQNVFFFMQEQMDPNKDPMDPYKVSKHLELSCYCSSSQKYNISWTDMKQSSFWDTVTSKT